MRTLWIYIKNAIIMCLSSCFLGIPFLLHYAYIYLFGFVFSDKSTITVAAISAVVITYLFVSIVYSSSSIIDLAVKDYELKYNRRSADLDIKESSLLKREEKITNLLAETKQSYPWTAMQIADLQFNEDYSIATALRSKSRPAKKAADELTRIAKEKKILIAKSKSLEYQLEYFEALFPWLEEFKELPPIDGAKYIHDTESNADNEYEILKKWLSPEEYSKLSATQKYQLALDRYRNRKKNDWEVGIEYERYIGYMYEKKGFRVQYHGALMGKQDMGRDLLVEKGNELLVIQCKRWAKEKTIHEKHIFQLYGSAIQLRVEKQVYCVPVFVTTTSLSETAKKCADYLNIHVIENYEFHDYPLIKCNISKKGEKIYHLPFDQQYDRVRISFSKGEKYVSTVEEAEKLGFRRAQRWSGNDTISN